MKYEHTQEAYRDAKMMERYSIIGDDQEKPRESMEEATERRLREFCATCHGTGSKDGKHLDCPDCMAAEIIAAHKRSGI